MPQRGYIEYVVVRDSEDLGLDKGRRLLVVPDSYYADGSFDVDIPALDMRITRVKVPHPDLRLVLSHEAHLLASNLPLPTRRRRSPHR